MVGFEGGGRGGARGHGNSCSCVNVPSIIQERDDDLHERVTYEAQPFGSCHR